MGRIRQSIGRVFEGGAKSFSRFPASMISALAIAVAASILIGQDSGAHEDIYQKIQLAFVLGAFLGMALSVLSLRLASRPYLFWLANLVALLAAGGILYLLLQAPGEIPALFAARIVAASAVSFLIFLLVIAWDISRSDFNQASFMVLKSAFIALIYALVIMLGLFFVAFTIESLLYPDLDEKIYMHIAAWSAFGWFAFFLGYFPSFRKDQDDGHLETAQKHPAFIEILLAYVLIPILAVLTLVLLIWAAKILINGQWPEFGQLTVIFSAYSLTGIFLIIMTSHYDRSITTVFRRLFPIAAILFLAFEAYAIIEKVGQEGIKTQVYFIALIWIFALVCVALMLFQQVSRNRRFAWLAIVLIILSVLPVAGYQDLTVSAQTRRLQKVLVRNDMLVNNKILTAPAGISTADKITITDSFNYIQSYEEAAKAGWLSDSISASSSFKLVFGFDETYGEYNPGGDTDIYTYLNLPGGSLNISVYQYAAHASQARGGEPLTITGQKGTYTIALTGMSESKNPILTVTLDNDVILKQELLEWLNGLQQKYQGSGNKEVSDADREDLLLGFNLNGTQLLVIFDNITIRASASGQFLWCSLNINAVYLAEP